MSIEIVRHIPWDELEAMVRKIPLKKPDADGQLIYPYKDARISLRTGHPAERNPTTFYLLREQLARHEALEQEFDKYGIDLLNLHGGVEFRDDQGQQWRIIPPVVEYVEEEVRFVSSRGDISYDAVNSIKVPIINDGAHREYRGLQQDRATTVIAIDNIPFEHPFYAYPNLWSDVQLVDAVSKTMAEKKLYRRKDSYALYRNFDVLGVGKPRGVGS
ncbi:hypothetical protein HZB00_03335 [Candidatus Woesearchaeota archaeon]|nr:hypothetical protein [Candidatus Woesearchaeota archaeon]